MVSYQRIVVTLVIVSALILSCLPPSESKISKIKMKKKIKMLQEMLPYIMMMKKKKILPVPVPLPIP
jgi:hypothetical protein